MFHKATQMSLGIISVLLLLFSFIVVILSSCLFLHKISHTKIYNYVNDQILLNPLVVFNNHFFIIILINNINSNSDIN